MITQKITGQSAKSSWPWPGGPSACWGAALGGHIHSPVSLFLRLVSFDPVFGRPPVSGSGAESWLLDRPRDFLQMFFWSVTRLARL